MRSRHLSHRMENTARGASTHCVQTAEKTEGTEANTYIDPSAILHHSLKVAPVSPWEIQHPNFKQN